MESDAFATDEAATNAGNYLKTSCSIPYLIFLQPIKIKSTHFVNQ